MSHACRTSPKMRRTISVQVDLGGCKAAIINEEGEETEEEEASKLQFNSSSSTTSTDVNESEGEL